MRCWATWMVIGAVAWAQERPGGASAGSENTRWEYPAELALAFAPDGRRLRATRVDGSGDVRPGATAGKAVWLDVRHVYQPDETLRQSVAPRIEIRNGDDLLADSQRDVAVPLVLRRTMPAFVVTRSVLSTRGASRLYGVCQNERAHLHQVEYRPANTTSASHCVRVEQWSGPEVSEKGYPMLQTTESLGSVIGAASDAHHNQADTERVVQVFAAGRGRLARVVEHHIGKFQWPLNGVQTDRTVHVVTEVVRQGGVTSFRTYTSDGRERTGPVWDYVVATGDTGELLPPPGRSNKGRRIWESPWHPRDPGERHAANMPYLVMLSIPDAWNRGEWDGQPLPPKPVALSDGGRRWVLRDDDFRWATGLWRFDDRGQLALRTPLGDVDGRAVLACFKGRVADAGADRDKLARVRHEIQVITAWATFMPQLRGDQRRRAEPAVLRLLPADVRKGP